MAGRDEVSITVLIGYYLSASKVVREQEAEIKRLREECARWHSEFDGEHERHTKLWLRCAHMVRARGGRKGTR